MDMMMIGRRLLFLAGTLIILLTMTVNVMASPILTSHQIIVIQGDDPITEVVEPGNKIQAVERFYFAVPYNETYIEVPVPKNASSVGMKLDQVIYSQQMETYIPGKFSEFFNVDNPPKTVFLDMTGMECCYADFYSWEFPLGADRNVTSWNLIGNNVFFNTSLDIERSDDVWNTSDSDLKLNSGREIGDYYSTLSMFGLNITKIHMSWSVPEHPENVSISISNDNGTSWMDITDHNDEEIFFPSEGNQFLWKINMSQDIELNNTPVLDYLWINTTYLDDYTYLTLQLDYVMERKNGEFSITWDFFMNKHSGRSPHILLYLDKDHTLVAENIDILFWGEQNEFPEKDTYFFMSNHYSPVASVTISKIDDSSSGNFPWLFLLVFIAIALIITLIVINKPKGERSSDETDEEGEAESETMEEDIPGMEEELQFLNTKKDGLLKAMKKLDSDLKEGVIDEDVHNDLKASYKKKTVEIMKQMDLLSANIARATEETQGKDEELIHLREEKKKILLSIKQLDLDYEEGTIDEDSYKELRDKYKKKAVEIAKHIEASTDD